MMMMVVMMMIMSVSEPATGRTPAAGQRTQSEQPAVTAEVTAAAVTAEVTAAAQPLQTTDAARTWYNVVTAKRPVQDCSTSMALLLWLGDMLIDL
jgi:protein-disulfide isomerase